MALVRDLREGLGFFEEEMELLERSSGGSATGVSSAIDTLKSALRSAYPKVSGTEIDGIVTHHVGKAMREARALQAKAS